MQMRSLIRRNSKDTRRKPRASFWLRERSDDNGPRFGELIQIGQQLDLVVIGVKDVCLEGIIILRRGCSGIGVRGLVTARGDLAILVKVDQRFLAPPGIVRDAL